MLNEEVINILKYKNNKGNIGFILIRILFCLVKFQISVWLNFNIKYALMNHG